MAGIENISPSIAGEPRRWSEPVPIGQIIADLRARIEARRENAARPGRLHVSARNPLRRAG